jgi:3-phosphoshikimate 1-carboxyvinyltransferase
MAAAPLDVEAIEKRKPSPDALAQLLFTSGTSGRPKGVLHRHDVLMKAAALQALHLGIDGEDRIFVPSPLGHQTGFLYGMWLALLIGVPQILQAVWNPERALRVLRECRGTFIQAAPTFLADMVQVVKSGVRAPTSLRIFVPTGAAVPRALAQQAAQVLRTRICGAYGTSEGGLATLAAPTDPEEKAAGSDGRPLESIQIRICDDGGNVLPAGQEGHLQTRSPTMFEGYLDEAELTANAYTADGWYRTADLGRIDAEGYLYITGRVNDIINRGGEKIPVGEIEQILYQHPAVKEVAIVAMPDSRLGERACVFIVPRPGAHFDFQSMQGHLDSHRVAKPHWPERLELVSALPKTASGKIMKYVLREWTRISEKAEESELSHEPM